VGLRVEEERGLEERWVEFRGTWWEKCRKEVGRDELNEENVQIRMRIVS